MASRLSLRLVTAGALALAVASAPAFASAARDRAATTIEFSAQKKDEKKAAPRTVAPRQAPVRVAPRQAPVRVAPRQAPVRVAPRQAPVRVAPRQQAPRNIQRQVVPQNKLAPKVVAPVTTAPRVVTPKSGLPTATRKVFTPRGNNAKIVTTSKIRAAPTRGAFRTSIRGRNYSVWRSGYRVRRGGGWRTFVALGTLGILAIGAAEYYPYAYIDAPEDYCDGLTEDGCQLVYDEVQTVEGDVIGQCVAYCPWQ